MHRLIKMAVWHLIQCEWHPAIMRTRLRMLPLHPSSISLSNVSFCVPILGTEIGTCLSDGPALRGFQQRTLTYSFSEGLAAPVIRKVRVLCYEFTDVTLA